MEHDRETIRVIPLRLDFPVSYRYGSDLERLSRMSARLSAAVRAVTIAQKEAEDKVRIGAGTDPS